MSQNSDKKSPEDRKPPARKSAPSTGPLQGEGDYEAARRYREGVADFVSTENVEQVAREAAPASAKEARDLALAEDRGRDRSKGDDAADPGIMYPGRKADTER